MKLNTSKRKRFRVSNKVKKVASINRFRLSISRSAKNISAQIIDDSKNVTLISASSVEKEIKLASFPCYEDNERTLLNYIEKNLKGYKGLTGEIINLIINNSNMDRGIIKNEIVKIKDFFLNKRITKDEILEILNIKNDSGFDEIRDKALSGNKYKINKLLSETEILNEEVFSYLNSLNYRVTRLYEIIKLCEENKNNYEQIMASLKPPIFWKDKPVILQCDDVLVAIGQDNSFEWIERDIGLEFGEWDMPVVNPTTFQSTHPKVFFGGDAAWGPENIIWAAAHGHQAAISIHKFCQDEDINDRPAPGTNLVSQKMGLHEWSYDNDISQAKRFLVPKADQDTALKSLKIEVEKGFDANLAMEEAQRCLNCDVQTVFSEGLCIECDACVDICPTDCINFMFNGPEDEVRQNTRIPALNIEQDLLVSKILPTKRTMFKDEDVCLHCGLCAERCPTGAWDMQTFLYEEAKVYS